MKLKLILLLCILNLFWGSSSVVSQTKQERKDLVQYIPYPERDELLYPEITLKVHLHIVYRYEGDEQNYTLDSINLIRKQFDWINGFYRDLSPSTLPAKDGRKHFIPHSRIRFRLDEVSSITDSVAWDRIFVGLVNKPVKIDSTDGALVYFRKQDFYRLNRSDSLMIGGAVYYKKDLRRNQQTSILELTTPVKRPSPKEVFYFRKKDLNCDQYIWEKYTNSDTSNLHVFFTGSSMSEISFGCGPRPYFLNLSNLHKGGEWANAQLIAHELGHTLGLRHTNYPQFDDLPAHDRFGFVMCNNKDVSNNIMGYNMCRNYLSPKQIGWVHYLYSTHPNRIVLTTANEYVDTNVVNIWFDTVWNKAMIITGDIVVRKRQTLTIKNLVHMSRGSHIYLEKKAKLIVDGAEITNYFNTPWQGIVVCKVAHKPNKKPKKKKNQGKVILQNGGQILQTSSIP